MTAQTFLQPLIFGLQMGAIFILVALGLTIILSVMNIINLAHGEIYMLGAFGVFYFASIIHLNYGIALLLSMIAVGLLGMLLERVFFSPAHGETVTTVIVAIGLMWILETAAQIIFGTQPRGMAEVFQGSVSFLNINISNSRIFAAIIAFVLVGVVYLIVYKTKIGKAMQAVAQDREAATLQGIEIQKINTIGFGLGCALAAVAGGIMAPIFFLQPTMGDSMLTNSIAIIVLGGLGSIPGAAIGGLILGIAESYGSIFWGYPSVTLPFIIIMLVLIFKRNGLMGIKT